MTALKCVVEGCNLEYDVVCSFSFYNANISTDKDDKRQQWIEGAMQEESECLWRHVSLQLCGYHFEMDNQGLWVDSPILPEILAPKDKNSTVTLTPAQQKGVEVIRLEHNYAIEPPAKPQETVSRLNVRQLVDTLGYMSLKNLQRKQLWVVKVESGKAEASITQTEQVITKMSDPKQIIEIIPQSSTSKSSGQPSANEVLQIMEDDTTTIADNFIYEIAEEQEISMEDVKEIPSQQTEWMVNIVPDDPKPKYAYIKHCNSGKKKRHFTADINEVTVQGGLENYYILPDADPSVGVEITTSYEPENYIVQEYDHLVLEGRPKKPKVEKKKRKRQEKVEEGEDWVIQNNLSYDDDDEDKKVASRVRRKNKKYLGYDFVT